MNESRNFCCQGWLQLAWGGKERKKPLRKGEVDKLKYSFETKSYIGSLK